MNMLEAVEEYQCPGCMQGPDPKSCPQFKLGDGCMNHHPGTMMLGVGTIALGLPKGFNRFGPLKSSAISIYESIEKLEPNCKSIFSVPVWKHFDKHGNTITRWFSPRTNTGWSAVILGDVRDQLPNAIEITAEHIARMD